MNYNGGDFSSDPESYSSGFTPKMQSGLRTGGSFTCEEVPEVVGFYCLLVPAPTRLPVFDLVGSDDAILRAARRRLPGHLDALEGQTQAARGSASDLRAPPTQVKTGTD